jgi:hypothetical protein
VTLSRLDDPLRLVAAEAVPGGEVPAVRAVARPRARLRSPDVAIVAGIVVVAVLLHPVGAILHRPYWLDEMWVAALAHAPLSRQLALSSSTPVGWVLLLRLVPGGLDAPLRLVPFAFGIATAAVAYLFARSLSWRTAGTARVAGLAASVAALMAPAVLVRNDLKQYTADSCCALVVLLLVSRVESAPTRRRVGMLAVAAVVSASLSTTSAFVTVAGFAALLATFLARRSWSAARVTAAGAAAALAVIGAYFALVIVPHDNGALQAFWRDAYLPASPGALLAKVWHRTGSLSPMFAVPGVLLVALLVAGCVRLVRSGHRAVALAVGLVWIEMVGAGVARRYPFLNLRTSHFLIVMTLVVATVGACSVAGWLQQRWGRPAVLGTLCVAALFVANSVHYVHTWWVPQENVRAAVEYVAAHRAPDDVIAVTLASNYGFSAYWPGSKVEYLADPSISMGFVTRVQGLSGVVYSRGVTEHDTTSLLRRSLSLAAQRGAAHVWIVRTHLYPDERAAWTATFRRDRLQPRDIHLDHETVWVVDVAPAGGER